MGKSQLSSEAVSLVSACGEEPVNRKEWRPIQNEFRRQAVRPEDKEFRGLKDAAVHESLMCIWEKKNRHIFKKKNARALEVR